MAAFQAASAPDAFEKNKQKTKSPPKVSKLKDTGLTIGPGGAIQSTRSQSPKPQGRPKPIKITPEKEGQTIGKVVENRVSPKKDNGPKDWNYLYDLSQNYDNFKAQEADAKKARAGAPAPAGGNKRASATDEDPFVKKDIKSSLEKVMGGNYTAKADWLDHDWIGAHLVEDTKYKTLKFQFGDMKLFKRFDKTDEKNRNKIVEQFVSMLVTHPRAGDITSLQMANVLLPDEFLVELSKQVLASKGLPKVQVVNFETNCLQGSGIVALADIIASKEAWKYLQVIMLENQKHQITSAAEEALANAIAVSDSIVVCSLRVRGGLERTTINNTIAENIDILRQARRQHAKDTGTLKARKRNEMELYFDKIAANGDTSITAVDLVGDAKFSSLNSTEKTKAGAAFANNTSVKTVKMVKLGLDDKFAEALGKALETNTTIEKLIVDSNAITGEGIRALFAGLAKNSTITELQVRHQSKTMSSKDEEMLPDLLEPNQTIIKLGVDARDQLVKMKLDRKTNANREHQRKLRAAAKKAGK